MDKLRIHYFQHVEFEGIGCIEQWMKEKNYQLSCTRFYNDDSLPEIDDIDWLIVMGGPMGVHDKDIYLWLQYEKAFIKKAIDAGKTVFGICLGAQLIANVLGTKVYPNPYKEIGWFDVSMTKEGHQSKFFKDFNDIIKVFHWHGDTFDIPNGAQRLFQSVACKNQSFLYKNNVLGVQFHLEVTEEILQEMILNGKHELKQGEFVQNEEEILTQRALIKENNELMYRVLDRML